jgi:hypothetical protein
MRLSLVLLLVLVLPACGEREDVVVYEVASPAAYAWPETGARDDAAEGLVWTVPAGWVAMEDVPDGLIADYRLPGSGEALPGRVTVSMIMGDAGGFDANVGRWRDQFFFALPEDTSRTVRVSPVLPHLLGTMRTAEMHGQFQGAAVPSSMLTAVVTILDRDGRAFATWFFKLAGDEATVRAAGRALGEMAFSLRPEGMDAPDLRGGSPDPATDNNAPDAGDDPGTDDAPQP